MGENGRCGCNLLAVPRGKWRGYTMTTDTSKANDSALRHESSERSFIGALKGEDDASHCRQLIVFLLKNTLVEKVDEDFRGLLHLILFAH